MSPIFMLSINILAVYFVFWLIRPINFSKFMPYTPTQAMFLKIVMAIVVGYLLASFFISMTNWILEMPSAVFGK
ncbi:DUF1146 domain-containing protein [Leuconostoc gelidum subsp. gelidum]|uniref:DUF1146 domain-containing protein n=1 Tax=Leuconostoc gelidum subsp. gelidum TaxID=1607839 RepID=A0AB35G1R4_LEUGE|nr:DUF1146 family protein [Leuconostoc gelidum]MBZ5964709.1 DUF1146 domain-containing protein [Leuconostoc gelidum subsp. gelidum]MBZ5974686.1 DUF1146 domain-containing protein [Leuconostoc gelidum subsp. gelidum]MBZ5977526.1 DUF1146 domain-containing protein [Leuconostoc gelidum subsp. gelidum]MBZ5986536.1 DUF1146 domain-containing protein [Leuconostoc gelidum subsp. gelidum]MBZ5999237.1 DUF1146 domain-containing protein [Leuconostoc gelidum subsp. gelidum]